MLDERGKPVAGARVDAELEADRKKRGKRAKAPPQTELAGLVVFDNFVSNASYASRRPTGPSAKTDKDGIAKIRGLRDEQKYVFTASGGDIVATDSPATEVSSAKPTELSIRSIAGGFVTVSSFDAWKKPAPHVSFNVERIKEKSDKSAAPQQRLRFAGNLVIPGYSARSGKTDATGRSTIGPLAPGKYRIKTVKESGGHFGNFATVKQQNGKKNEGKSFEIRSGETSEVSITQGLAVRLEGVLLENGEPITNCNLYLMRQSKSGNRFGSFGGQAMTDGEGKFRFRSVEPGEYILQVIAQKTTVGHEMRLTVAPTPAVQSRTFSLSSGSFEVLVRDAKSGAPIEGARVIPMTSKWLPQLKSMRYSKQEHGGVLTDKNGRARVRVASGQSFFAFVQKDGFASEVLKELTSKSGTQRVALAAGASLDVQAPERSIVRFRLVGSKKWVSRSLYRSKTLSLNGLAIGDYEFTWASQKAAAAGPGNAAWSAITRKRIEAGKNTLRLTER